MRGFSWRARIYWEDTDGGGIVYYANYLRFLERARTEWLRSLGYSQAALAADPGILFSVISLEVDYRAPARLDDEIEISCEPQQEGGATLNFLQEIHRLAPAQLLLEAEVRIACLDAQTLRPRRLPQFLVNAAATAGGTKLHG